MYFKGSKIEFLCTDPEGGGGGGGIRGSEPHWKITSSIGVHRNKQLDPPENGWTPPPSIQ